MKHLLFLILLATATTVNAQKVDYEIHNSSSTERFDSKGNVKSKTMWASGVKDGDKVLNVDIETDGLNRVTKLIMNGDTIRGAAIVDYKPLTDYVIAYIYKNDQVAEEGKTVTTVVGADDPKKPFTEADKRRLNDLIKEELVKDKLVDPNVFDFMLTGDKLYINGQRQEQPIFEKYKELYDRYADLPLSKTTYFQITQSY